MDIFKPEDFKGYTNEFHGEKYLAEHVNSLFNSWLSKQPMVYGSQDTFTMTQWISAHGVSPDDYTHAARLICIEEIKKEPCKHEPTEYESNYTQVSGPALGEKEVKTAQWKSFTYECHKCRKSIKPTGWEVVE